MSPLFPFVRARGAAVYVFLVVALLAATSGGQAQSSASTSGNRPKESSPPENASQLPQAAASAPSGQASPQQQPPRFRAGTNLVRVDVYPSMKGVAVPDLTAPDFEVLEDGVPQKVEAFEHVVIQPAVETHTTSTTTTTDGQPASKADGRSRIFVLFLDTYFTDLGGSRRARTVLARFLERLVGPDDLIGVMTPDMAASDVTLVHRAASAEDMLSKYWIWGKRDTEVVDPVEDQYLTCYPRNQIDTESGRNKYPGVADEMIQRRREKRVIDALGNLAKHLQTVSDARKAVITVTDGWVLFKPNLEMTERGQYHQARSGVGADGRLTTNVNTGNGGLSTQACEQARVSLAMVDDKATYDTLIDTANRSNVSFYPVSVGGLRAFDHDLSTGSGEALSGERQAADGPTLQTSAEIGPLRLATDRGVLGQRVDSLQSLAVNTDGVAITGVSNVDNGLQRIVDDLSSYYVLGYASTNGKLDGKFRKITVRVKRVGVDVRARRGYRAPTQKEVEEGAMAEAQASAMSAPASAIQVALDALAPVRPGVPLRTSVSAGDVGGRSHGWLVAEIDSSLFRQPDWAGGAVADIAILTPDEIPLANKRVVITSDQRGIVVDLGELPAKGVIVRTKITPQGGGPPYTDTIHLAEAAGVRALLSKRGPTTGVRYVPTAVPQFSRTERIRVDVPADATATVSAEILDRAGKPINVPVRASTRVEGGVTWASAEVSLAPLGTGEYLVRLTAGSQNVVTAFRLTP